ncbi:hypothetical protein ZYGR_0S02760 [Zygosaccharomyces rouxii]|uniref:ZYRO0F08668p n=2 Tax=Zygosaccharomyces rouxii TaxID=4956 RepID=C5DXY1_ZYGRC|nr:uncharacterized protein ZYRO0F08668g [Zygosaccharomyces rouxii]KAH9199399.1 hypothetical protein LQ764DRAFT_210547 [Zygosaccharomyces rouxii]GAV50142.1 hypothetical protein ZYGR_0S02760 [Zygosaccharomyces rouxii]CAR28642.1 ZYRO0F08668p [Zygosaccharomyces rouxii]
MNFNVPEEERYNLEKFRFPMRDERDHNIPESLRRLGLEPSTTRHRQLDIKNLRDQVPDDGSLFQELSRYRMVPVSNHRRQRHHSRGLQKTLSPRSKGDERKSVSPLRHLQPLPADSDYVYHSPSETIRNLNEQMERNFNGRYGSLVEFADNNQLDVEGKNFASCEEPKIDLEQGFEEALRATRIS